MNFTNVTAVIQVGLTTAGQYVSRLGATARAGNEGKSIHILNDFEKPFLSEIKHLPIQPAVVTENTLLSALTKPGARTTSLTAADQDKLSSHPLKSVLSTVESSDALRISAKKCSQAWLSYHYHSLGLLNWDKATLAQFANKFSATCGLKTIPALPRRAIDRMELRNVPGIREEESRSGSGGRA
jgi:superfamily II DNA/RNA helicase